MLDERRLRQLAKLDLTRVFEVTGHDLMSCMEISPTALANTCDFLRTKGIPIKAIAIHPSLNKDLMDAMSTSSELQDTHVVLGLSLPEGYAFVYGPRFALMGALEEVAVLEVLG